jgi:ketosteroid isomerase-like protein
MASANLELVRSIVSAWERGEYGSLEWAHPEIEFVIADLPDSGIGKGAAGMAEGWLDFLGAWDAHRVEADEYRELDAERVLVLGHFNARGKASGMEVGQVRSRGADLFHVRDGWVTRLVIYFDQEHALADVGLAQDVSSQGS